MKINNKIVPIKKRKRKDSYVCTQVKLMRRKHIDTKNAEFRIREYRLMGTLVLLLLESIHCAVVQPNTRLDVVDVRMRNVGL